MSRDKSLARDATDFGHQVDAFDITANWIDWVGKVVWHRDFEVNMVARGATDITFNAKKLSSLYPVANVETGCDAARVVGDVRVFGPFAVVVGDPDVVVVGTAAVDWGTTIAPGKAAISFTKLPTTSGR